MPRYLALLRGINVGGNSIIKMADLRKGLEEDGFTDVVTYIQSGNVVVSAPFRSTARVAKEVSASIARRCGLDVEVVAFTSAEWKQVIEGAPAWWGIDDDLRHYLYVLLPPFKMPDVLKQIGEPVEGIEFTQSGSGVVYSSVTVNSYSRTTAAKLVAKPIYKRMTIRNYNTSKRLLTLLEQTPKP